MLMSWAVYFSLFARDYQCFSSDLYCIELGMLRSLSITRADTKKGILSAFAGFTGFALADACSKWLGAYYSTPDILFWVYSLGAFFGLCLSPYLGGLKPTLQTKKLPYHILRGVCALAVGMLVVTALSKGMMLSTMYTILFLAPFLTTIAAIPIYKERVSLRSWIIIAVGFSGILVAFHDGLAVITPEILYIFAALFFITSLGLLARPLQHDTLLSLSLYPSITIAVLLLPLVWGDIAVPQISHWPIFILDAFCVILGLSGIAYGFRIAPYATVAPVHYSQMVIAVLIGYFVFGDVPDFWIMAGAAIIIVSGLLLIFSRERD